MPVKPCKEDGKRIGKHYYVHITCSDCNKSRYVRKDHMKRKGYNGRCRPCSMKHNNKSGEEHHNWKGGITPEYEKQRAKLKSTGWHYKIFKRDKFKCQICGDKSGSNLESHHIKSFIDYPDNRYDLNNGITLCSQCHHWIHDSLEVLSFQ